MGLEIEQLLRAKAEETTRDADRYALIKRALHWLEDTGRDIDIFPEFRGHYASSCIGYKDVIKLLDEHVSMKMSAVIQTVRESAEAELKALDQKYG
ncbi:MULTISPECIES: hypothetical protein [unclassified Mesorhizobium]|uniref:hypothetical protein n=1 Tax=unclassified Mesorhizobium TaxID=325217 RepID=UPI001127423C|nr:MULTISPECIES: hypothetical protein [unclassified Mesorhizobium]TPJ51624.1 hypothetical protein FJ426_20545 [Mesorhizobium sp. B2-6-4]TPN42302.1 hypothetical protein FJ979_01825 [Mesorhizobium sp. B1-1-6]